MIHSIQNFAKQFEYTPVVERVDLLGKFRNVIVAGMGGSHLAAGIIKTIQPGIDIYVHRDYGLPPYSKEFFEDSLCVACSYSGNTEETVDFAEKALANGYKLAVITTGGRLEEFADKNNLPIIRLPRHIDGQVLQPRMAIGFSTLALLEISGNKTLLDEVKRDGLVIDPNKYKEEGKKLAQLFANATPIIYSSLDNLFIAYQWKIKFNETAKLPAFYNIFPELNHNEMNGFDIKTQNQFAVAMLEDDNDDPRIKRRMELTKQMYEERGLGVAGVKVLGGNRTEKVFGTLLVADWCALTLAESRGVEPAAVHMIESFKKRL